MVEDAVAVEGGLAVVMPSGEGALHSPALSIVCVSTGRRYAADIIAQMGEVARALDAEFILALDTPAHNRDDLRRHATVAVTVETGGYIERVLSDVLALAGGEYVLRLDDDELPSVGMARWLASGAYRSAILWAFPRANLWGDRRHRLAHPALWPDLQTRLSVRGLAHWGNRIHCGHPHGTGRVAPCVIEHYKYLLLDRGEREQIARQYEAVQPGAGLGAYKIYSLPEDVSGGTEVVAYDGA